MLTMLAWFALSSDEEGNFDFGIWRKDGRDIIVGVEGREKELHLDKEFVVQL
jgi:hypothetical protein